MSEQDETTGDKVPRAIVQSGAPGEPVDPAADPALPRKPPGTPEFTLRAVIVGCVVALLMGASYPYVVLKLGFGPNVSVVAAFFGYLFLGIAGWFAAQVFRKSSPSNRWENNIVQTAGTSAAQTAFMCIILAAFDLVGQNKDLEYDFSPSVMQSFLWLTAASVLGLLLAVPMRRHYIVEENLTYADGVAAAETIVVLDARGPEAKAAAKALFLATLASAVFWFLTTKWAGQIFGFTELDDDCINQFTGVLPENVLPTMFGLTFATAGAGFSVSLLSLGSGMIVGNRINISMAIGATIAWVIGPHVLADHGIISGAKAAAECHGELMPARGDVLLWMMWPGTGMLVAGGLTALFLKWKTMVRTFSTLSTKSIDKGEFPLKWVGLGVLVCTVALLVIQLVFFDVPIWTTLIAAALSVPLMLVGLRVLGETNWGPISQLTNMMQVIFAAIRPHNITANLAASGTTGTIATQSEAIMQDYKCGHIIGSTPRFLTYSQLIAAPIGAIAVALSYPAFKSLYGVGNGPGQLSAPGSRRIAGFAAVLNEGFDKLPKYGLTFLIIGAIVGILITFGEIKWKKYIPSATGLGIGMMVPGNVVFTMVLGGIGMTLWTKYNKKSADQLGMPLASGLIAGEALAAIILPVIVAIGLLAANPTP